jgi:hypothetical protein
LGNKRGLVCGGGQHCEALIVARPGGGATEGTLILGNDQRGRQFAANRN